MAAPAPLHIDTTRKRQASVSVGGQAGLNAAGPRKYIKLRPPPSDRQIPERTPLQQHAAKQQQRQQAAACSSIKASSLPSVAGIITSGPSNHVHLPYILFCSFDQPAPQLTQPPSISAEDEKKINDLALSKTEVIRRLRNLEQPVTLFGEDDDTRLLRFKDLLKNSSCLDPETDGLRNDLPLDLVDFKKNTKRIGFLRRDNKSKRKLGGTEYCAAEDGNGQYAGVADNNNTDGGAMDGIIPDLEIIDAHHEDMKNNFDTLCDGDKILVFFKQLLREWASELHKRPESEKRTEKGRSHIATLEQSARFLAPLFDMCRKRTLPPPVSHDLLAIVTCCLQKDYLAAMNQYIKLALRDAPCPISVNAFDIHERGGREKTSTNTSIHLPNDDMKRKYLLSVKRLISLCQRRYPAILSKSVERNVVSNGNDSLSPLQKET